MLRLFAVFILYISINAAFATSQVSYPDVEMKAVKVSEHVWYVKGKAGAATENEGFVSNAGFVVTNDGVVVFEV